MRLVLSLHFNNLTEIKNYYLERHPDAKRWLLGDDEGAHLSYWARFDPESVYFVGGFGGRHYTGFIPMDLYQNAIPLDDLADSYPYEYVLQKQDGSAGEGKGPALSYN
ncbi:uncharacterized protein BT62DRAFT_919647 [Guyanagaster necrorhizus]|uniref:CREG-like beta-barrel domain-containing protein n=1 Tax=Guyanagaster necrorhizus TaxID=856835 RepID=A0A9P8ASM7_9AGAR|nr:uncharacterized protein BT62DRAFT_919647 [Guyanagaster necrorhizus MCA 3950]KAG7446315.1 hypothetical protein BT62DRAFT_919647 [Guyanagaster necrorhizus MCA 3950]